MRIGIDLGGTKTEVIALGDAGEQLYRHRLPTPRDDYRQTIETIATLVDMAEQATGQRGTVGMGIPGSISPYTGVVKNANSTWLNGQPFDKDLSARLQREVRLANDANCLAVSEAVDGAAAGAQTVFAVIIGTGCGAGVAFNGRAHIGGNGTAGEWGHNPLPWMDEDELRYREEVPCYCGKQGCIETFISGTDRSYPGQSSAQHPALRPSYGKRSGSHQTNAGTVVAGNHRGYNRGQQTASASRQTSRSLSG